MEINFYHLIGALGLICIISGSLMVSSRKIIRRKYVYPLLIAGGVFLEIYSIYIKDALFIILQGIFILTSIYGLIRLNEHRRKA